MHRLPQLRVAFAVARKRADIIGISRWPSTPMLRRTILRAFLAGYDLGELLAYKGIAEGVENSQFSGPYQPRLFHSDALRKARRGQGSPVLPRLDGASARAWHQLSAARPEQERRGAGRVAGRPAAIITFLDGMWICRPSPAHCAALGEALARLHLAGLDFKHSRVNALSVDGWRSPSRKLPRARA